MADPGNVAVSNWQNDISTYTLPIELQTATALSLMNQSLYEMKDSHGPTNYGFLGSLGSVLEAMNMYITVEIRPTARPKICVTLFCQVLYGSK